MGDFADGVLDGDFCQVCGVYMEGGDGYPRTCSTCLNEDDDLDLETKPKKKKKNKKRDKK